MPGAFAACMRESCTEFRRMSQAEFSANALLRLRLDFPAAGDLATQHEAHQRSPDAGAFELLSRYRTQRALTGSLI